MAKTITWRPTDDMAAWLQARAERSVPPVGMSARCRVEMELWRGVLGAELARQEWQLAELGVIADVCNGQPVTEAVSLGIGRVAFAVADAVRLYPDLYGQKWGVDEKALVDKLAQMGPAADVALADAVATWWETEAEHSLSGWARVGINPTLDGEGRA